LFGPTFDVVCCPGDNRPGSSKIRGSRMGQGWSVHRSKDPTRPPHRRRASRRTSAA